MTAFRACAAGVLALATALSLGAGAASSEPPMAEGSDPGWVADAPLSTIPPGSGLSGTTAGWLRLPDGTRARYAQDIQEVAHRYGVSTALVEAVIHVESSFNHLAVSPKGARGLMQLMPRTAQNLGVLDAFNPRQNIEGGVRHLRRLIDRYPGDLSLALAAYNAGESAVESYRGIPPYPETHQYVRKVLQTPGLATTEQGGPAPQFLAAAATPTLEASPGTGAPLKGITPKPGEPLPSSPLLDEARRAKGSTPSGTAISPLAASMRTPSRLAQETATQALIRMKEHGLLPNQPTPAAPATAAPTPPVITPAPKL